MNIKKVAVIGAGTMGAGIAGQAANAGWLESLDQHFDNPNLFDKNSIFSITPSKISPPLDES